MIDILILIHKKKKKKKTNFKKPPLCWISRGAGFNEDTKSF